MYILCTSLCMFALKGAAWNKFQQISICGFFFYFFHSIFMWRLKRTNEGKSKEKWKWFCENLLYIHSIYKQCVCAWVCVYCIFFLAFKNRTFFVFFLFNACVVAIVVVDVVYAVSAFSTCCKSSDCIRNIFLNVLVAFWFCGALETAARAR